MMRYALSMALLAMHPWLAAAQTPPPVATAAPAEAPRTFWTDLPGGAQRLDRAQITVPAAVGEFKRVRVNERTGAGLDAYVNYERADGAPLTLFLYQPINSEVDLHWQAVQRAMTARIRMPAGYPVATGELAVASGAVGWATVTSGAGAEVMTDLAALGRTSAGWYVKVRISAKVDGPTAVEFAQRFMAELKLPAGQKLAAPGPAPAVCAPVAAKGRARPVKTSSDDRLMSTLMAVLPMAAVGAPLPPRARCALGEGVAESAPYLLYRSAEPAAPVDYVATLGDGGGVVTLQPALTDARDPIWWLTLDLTVDRAVLQRFKGPVDDEDFTRLMADLPAILNGPVVTRVGRN